MRDTCNKKSFWCGFDSVVQSLSLLVIAVCAVMISSAINVVHVIPTQPPEGGRGPRITERGDGPRGERPADAPRRERGEQSEVK